MAENEHTVILPCRFCGSSSVVVTSKHNGTTYYRGTHSASVRCNRCHARGPTASCKVRTDSGYRYEATASTKELAIKYWNEGYSK